MISISLLLRFITLCSCLVIILSEDDQLVLVHAIFTPGKQVTGTYPGDLYQHYPSFPLKHGELSEKGQETSVNLGMRLRQRYNKFLGDIFTTNLTQAYSTYYQHSEASLQCVLYTLFPPGPTQQIAEFNWQPVPYKILKKDSPLNFLTGIPDIKVDYEIAQQLPAEFQYKTMEQIHHVYNVIESHVNESKILPKWATESVLTVMKSISDDYYKTLVETKRRELIGGLLKHIMDISEQKINGHTSSVLPMNRKIFLYSGKIIHVYALLEEFGFDVDNQIEEWHSVCVLIELYKQNNQSYVLKMGIELGNTRANTLNASFTLSYDDFRAHLS